MSKTRRLISEEQEAFIRTIYVDISMSEMTLLFNKKYGTNKGENQIKAFIKNNGITSGRTGCFKKGNFSWNTGTKGVMKKNKTSFKANNVPANIKPIGHERIDKDGFTLIKIKEYNPATGFPTRFKHKQVYVWEKANGKVPRGHVIFFKDTDKANFDPDNLICISRGELLKLNILNYKDAPAELRDSLLVLAKLHIKISDKKNNK